MSENNFNQNGEMPEFALKKDKIYPSFAVTGIFMFLLTLWYFAVNFGISYLFAVDSELYDNYLNNATTYYTVTMLFQILYLGVPVVLMLAIYKGNRAELLRLNPLTGKEIILLTVIGIFMFAGNLMLTNVNYLVASFFTDVEIPQAPSVYTTSDTLVMMIVLVAVAPVLEEISMRGIMMRGLEGKSKWFAIILTGVYFGMAHLSYYTLVPKILGGILLGYVAYATNSVYAGMILHLINNGLSGIMTVISDNINAAVGDEISSELTLNDQIASLIVYSAFSIGVIIVIVALLNAMRNMTKSPDGNGGYTYKGKIREKLDSEKKIRVYAYIPYLLALAVMLAFLVYDVIVHIK